MAELLLGAGSSRMRHIVPPGRPDGWSALTTLDRCDRHPVDVVWDLEQLPLPFADEAFDEIHAYEVLEHLGRQGDWRRWFAEWSEWYRLLRPGGWFCGSVPAPGSAWVWGDPSHTRAVLPECFVFLDQAEYTAQVGTTPMTDFRDVYRADFDLIGSHVAGDRLFFALRAIKPSRITA